MKYSTLLKCFLIFATLILSLGESAQARPSATSILEVPLTQKEKKSVDNLITRVQQAIPDGWKGSYVAEYRLLKITRKTPVSYVLQKFKQCDHEEKQKLPKEKFVGFYTRFRVLPLLAPIEYKRLQVENEATWERLSILSESLKKQGVDHKFDTFFPDAPTEEIQVAEYEKLKETVHYLPAFYFENVSLDWVGPRHSTNINSSPCGENPYLMKPSDKVECEIVEQKVLDVFSKYEKAEEK